MSSFNWAEETEKEQQQQAATTSQTQNERLLAHADIQKFEDLNLPEDLLNGIYAKGYNRPSNIQGKALPVILKEDCNLIAQSQSGTGKTATFGIGMLCAVDKSLKQPQAICCCPTYELGLQIFHHVSGLAQFTGITVGTALKGVDINDDMSFQVIIATPGTLMNLLLRKKNFDVSRVKLLVVDEADQMIEAPSFQSDLGKIKNKLPKNIRVLLFSATFAEGELGNNTKEKEEAIMKFAKAIVPPPFKTLLIPKEDLTLENMKQFYVNCGDKEGKFTLLKEIYEGLSVGQSIIFLNTKVETEELLQRLSKEGFKVAKLTGEMEAAQRKAVIEDFRTGKAKVLLSTNVLSRGLDIDTVTHVLNYDLPHALKRGPQLEEPDFATYLHRIGRTARYGRKGVAINFVGGKKDLAMVKAFEKYFKREIKEVKTEDVIEEIK